MKINWLTLRMPTDVDVSVNPIRYFLMLRTIGVMSE